MSGYRLPAPAGGAIDRSQALRFTFNGAAYAGFAGDTVASALLAAGVQFTGRSFKYHRPRGIVSCGVEEPTGLLDIDSGATRALFLAPGYGAQGASAADAMAGLVWRQGSNEPPQGGVVSASRSILYPAAATAARTMGAWRAAIDCALEAALTELSPA